MTSLNYRKERMKNITNCWELSKINDFFSEWQIPDYLFFNLKRSIKLYICRALHFKYDEDDIIFLKNLDKNKKDRTNVTPNGAIVPKKEYVFEYNSFLRDWCKIVSKMIERDKSLLSKFRLTPNIRIKYGQELEDNLKRGLNTSIPHSDAWVEGPWGMNCHLPILGDTENNFLNFYKLKDENQFKDEFLKTSLSYNDMSWVLDYYDKDNIVPKKGFVNISDYVLIHNTKRTKHAKTRISIDTTIFVGNHEVHPDREIEYLNEVPLIGENLFIRANISENDPFQEKLSTFSNYTSGSLNQIKLKV